MTKREGRTWEVLQVVMGILLAICTTMSSWMLTTVINHGNRLAAIESNRYTSEKALVDKTVIADQLLSVWKEIAKVQQTVSKNEPSAEVLRWLERLEEQIDEIKKEGHT